MNRGGVPPPNHDSGCRLRWILESKYKGKEIRALVVVVAVVIVVVAVVVVVVLVVLVIAVSSSSSGGGGGSGGAGSGPRKPVGGFDAGGAEPKASTGYGLISQWQRLRTGL